MNPAPLAPSVLRPAGPVAQVIAEMGWVLIIGGSLVFCAVMLALVWALRQPRAPAAAAAAGHRRAVAWWVLGGGFVFPVLVLSALLAYASARTAALAPQRLPQEPVITVTAHMWWWQVRYDDPAGGSTVVAANEIHLPAGRAVTLGLASADVIHAFWVPALAGKVDMVPGRVHQLRLQADAPGVLRGQCAEFCGEQHARMALHVVVHPAAGFDAWLAAQALAARPPATALAQRGLQVFLAQRCSACHTVRGLGPEATIGPDLTHIGSRLNLGAGTVPMSRDALRDWVLRPQHVKPGVRMPAYAHLDDDALQALLAFLEQLQ